MNDRFARIIAFVKDNRFNKRLMRHFEWPLLLIVLALSLFGLVAIFSATSSATVSNAGKSFLETAMGQSFYYPRLQAIWIAIGLALLAATVYFDYELFGNISNWLYWANIVLLVLVLGMTRGRGNAAMFFKWGSDMNRTFQPAEVGKIAIILSMAKLFANRRRPIRTLGELIPVVIYVSLPLLLIVAQPDVGTALVYVAVFLGFLFVSGTNWKLLTGLACVAILAGVVGWFVLVQGAGGFRIDRILVWIDPTYDPAGAGMQTTNARIAAGSGGLLGRGMFAPGNFAGLGYIPDDHTDFIFAIICESFGFVGAGLVSLLYLLLLVRMMLLMRQAQDAFGGYIIAGVTAMIFFHAFENIAMVIGLMPVTGIPLPFISYGGSSYLTNIMGVGLVINVAMRSRAHTGGQQKRVRAPIKL